MANPRKEFERFLVQKLTDTLPHEEEERFETLCQTDPDCAEALTESMFRLLADPELLERYNEIEEEATARGRERNESWPKVIELAPLEEEYALVRQAFEAGIAEQKKVKRMVILEWAPDQMSRIEMTFSGNSCSVVVIKDPKSNQVLYMGHSAQEKMSEVQDAEFFTFTEDTELLLRMAGRGAWLRIQVRNKTYSLTAEEESPAKGG